MPAVAVREAGRERGALAVEAPGAIALTPRAGVGLRPADVRDLPATVQALARWPVLAAYRYQRNAGEPEPRLGLGAARFPFADGEAATAGQASATTFLTVDGRALTEMRVRVANQRQAFAKVALPAGGQIVSAALDEVAVRPVSSADGLRLPLRGNGTGPVRELTFVYLHDGGPFDRRGERQLALPRLDLPIGVVHWELFVPDALEVRRVGGSALEARPFASADPVPWGGATRRVDAPARPRVRLSAEPGGAAGRIVGRALDGSGSVLPGVTVSLRTGGFARTAVTDGRGEYAMDGVPAGTVALEGQLAGFTTASAQFPFDGRPLRVEIELTVATLMETITVSAAAPVAGDRDRPEPAPGAVVELQQRVAGILPVRVDVPRQGRAHAFVAPLVVDEAPTLTLRYRRR